jgi:hypothetical protein
MSAPYKLPAKGSLPMCFLGVHVLNSLVGIVSASSNGILRYHFAQDFLKSQIVHSLLRSNMTSLVTLILVRVQTIYVI